MKIKNYLIQTPQKYNDNTILIILLHGYGSNEYDLFHFKKDLPKSMLILSIQGPINLDNQSFAWYEFDLLTKKYNNLEEIKSSELLIIKLINNLSKKYIFNQNNIWICGFSQGAILAYSLLIKYSFFFKKGIILNGFLDVNMIHNINDLKSINNLHFFISHGIYDNIIPITLARKSYNILQKITNHITYKEYQSEHRITKKNYIDMINWIYTKI